MWTLFESGQCMGGVVCVCYCGLPLWDEMEDDFSDDGGCELQVCASGGP